MWTVLWLFGLMMAWMWAENWKPEELLTVLCMTV
jgi:hypothetical protein